MARIRNVELPKEKRTVIGLTYIYGIGRSLSEKICANTGVDPDKKIKDLTSEDEAKLRKEIENHLTEGDLRREVQMNIKNKMEINSYQGVRTLSNKFEMTYLILHVYFCNNTAASSLGVILPLASTVNL